MKITRRQLRKMIQEAILKEQERALDDQDAERREIIRKYKVAIDWFQNTLFPAIASDFVDGPVEVVALATQNGISGIPVALTDDDDVDTVGGLLTKHLDRLPVAGSTVEVDGLHLTAERTEGRRKRVITVLVEADQALIDAKLAFATAVDTGAIPIQDARAERQGSLS